MFKGISVLFTLRNLNTQNWPWIAIRKHYQIQWNKFFQHKNRVIEEQYALHNDYRRENIVQTLSFILEANKSVYVLRSQLQRILQTST